MWHEASPQEAPSPLVSTLFRIFAAMNCGAILLDESKRILYLNHSAQAHLGEALSTNKDRLCATDRGCDALFQTILDGSQSGQSCPDQDRHAPAGRTCRPAHKTGHDLGARSSDVSALNDLLSQRIVPLDLDPAERSTPSSFPFRCRGYSFLEHGCVLCLGL
jgi:hypothetical protein